MKLFSGKGWVRSTSPFDFKSFFADLFDSFEATNENRSYYRKWSRKFAAEENEFLHNINNHRFHLV